MRSVARTLILIASTLLAVVLLAAPASAAVCSTPFGSLPKDGPALGTGEVDSVRAGRHECFDRLVVDIDGPPAGYNVGYVDQVTADGSGAVVPTPGGARLPGPTTQRRRLLDLPLGHQRRQLRGANHLRARRPRTAAVPGLHHRGRTRSDRRRRRTPPDRMTVGGLDVVEVALEFARCIEGRSEVTLGGRHAQRRPHLHPHRLHGAGCGAAS